MNDFDPSIKKGQSGLKFQEMTEQETLQPQNKTHGRCVLVSLTWIVF